MFKDSSGTGSPDHLRPKQQTSFDLAVNIGISEIKTKVTESSCQLYSSLNERRCKAGDQDMVDTSFQVSQDRQAPHTRARTGNLRFLLCSTVGMCLHYPHTVSRSRKKSKLQTPLQRLETLQVSHPDQLTRIPAIDRMPTSNSGTPQQPQVGS